MEKQNFYDLNFDQLKAFLIEKGEVEPKKAKMRSQQLFNAVYKKNIKSFDELTTFGAEPVSYTHLTLPTNTPV